jgi:ribosomal protein S12 methylthiotransferase
MKIYFDTLGCPKNFNDSEMAMGLMEQKGHAIVGSADEADVIVVNTCGFINDAKKESIDEIFTMAQYKEQGKKLIVSGCLAQRYADELFEEMPEVDGFIGVNEYERLPELVSSLDSNAERFKVIDPCNLEDLEIKARKLPENPYSATLKIAEGCDNVCAYCVIPKIRGPYRSRSRESILEEAESLAKAGCRELILIAQDVTYYGLDLYGRLELPRLLKELCKIDGIEWIRLMYCYEDRITDELIKTMASEDKICNYIDIPIQHASDRILKSMNRRSTAKSLDETLGKLRAAMKDIHIRTTLIVGFPGETDEDYDKLIDFVEKQKFARLGVFAYSKEEGTPAAEMDDQIDDKVKAERLDGVMMRQMEISLELNRSKIGKIVEVMVDEKDDDGSYIGRTRYDAPEIDNSVIFVPLNDHKPGDIVNVLIEDAFDYDLEGREV